MWFLLLWTGVTIAVVAGVASTLLLLALALPIMADTLREQRRMAEFKLGALGLLPRELRLRVESQRLTHSLGHTALAADPTLDEQLQALRDVGDRLADEALDALPPDAPRHKLVEALRAHAVRHPSGPCARLLQHVNTVPDWVNFEAMRLASEHFAQRTLLVLLMLFCASLPVSYSCSYGAKVLVSTGRLSASPRGVLRRLLETSEVVRSVLVPDGLRPGGQGAEFMLRVRMLHAAVRRLCHRKGYTSRGAGTGSAVGAAEARCPMFGSSDGRNLVSADPGVSRCPMQAQQCTAAAPSPGSAGAAAGEESRWESARWGVPVNQEDMAGTALVFVVVLVRAMRALGARMTPAQSESLLHTWRYAGHLLGVDEGVLARHFSSMPAADTLMSAILVRQCAPDADSALLTDAVMRTVPLATRIMLGFAMPLSLMQALARYIMGVPLANGLGLAWRPFWLLRAAVMVGIVRLRVWLTDLVPAAGAWERRQGARALARMQAAVPAHDFPLREGDE